MERLAELFEELDSTTSINAKVNALARYFDEADDQDKVWTVALLSHRRPRRAVNYRLLGEWAAEAANLPLWLFEESYHIVGDYAETIALLVPSEKPQPAAEIPSLTDYMELMLRLREQEDEVKKREILTAWGTLTGTARFLFNKLITGGLRVGVSQKLMVRALAKSTGREENDIALQLTGDWNPATTNFHDLVLSDNPETDLSKPYPFFLAYALDIEPAGLGPTTDWLAERKWDGIRAQAIVRDGNLYIWTRGEELVTDRYPGLNAVTEWVPDGTVMDGELVAWSEENAHPLSFQLLQKRIGRKKVSKKLLAEIPVRYIVYDLMEYQGRDIRNTPLQQRRHNLEDVLKQSGSDSPVLLSSLIKAVNWEQLGKERELARENHCEGLMLKHVNSTYQVGRKKGEWWKWKADPFSVDAVLLYAQRGHGRRASLYTDFTFAVWEGERLVPFAKAYSGLSNDEFVEITNWVKRNTIERFGPVASVPPQHVFELHFEGISLSGRHKSGVAVRFPRIHRWRKDKKPEDADSLETIKSMIP